MRIFETSHGQVDAQNYYKKDFSLPMGNEPLTTLGKEQARLVARRLKALNFKGVIYSSPYVRTLTTASIIAEELGSRVRLLPCLSEQVIRVDENYSILTKSALIENYPRVNVDEDFSEVWRGDTAENLADVIERLKTGLKSILEGLPKEQDVLFVGHSTTAVALRHLFGITNNLGFHWNCHLSLLYSETGETYTNDCEHLPPTKRTENALTYIKQEEKFAKARKEMQALFVAKCEKKVLHVGDTQSSEYPYYKRLIAEVKPDVIVHTGDLADELKAGRIESVRPYWRQAAREILEIMRQSGARVIVVGGNNDIKQELTTFAPSVETAERNSVLELYGKRVCVCHEVWRIDLSIQADVYLYGHGLTGETRTVTDNERDGRMYFNAVWGPSLHCLERGVHYVVTLQ